MKHQYWGNNDFIQQPHMIDIALNDAKQCLDDINVPARVELGADKVNRVIAHITENWRMTVSLSHIDNRMNALVYFQENPEIENDDEDLRNWRTIESTAELSLFVAEFKLWLIQQKAA